MPRLTKTVPGGVLACLAQLLPPPGKEKNWVQTIPGKSWNTLLRLYGPLEPWFNKTWRPGEIEPQP